MNIKKIVIESAERHGSDSGEYTLYAFLGRDSDDPLFERAAERIKIGRARVDITGRLELTGVLDIDIRKGMGSSPTEAEIDVGDGCNHPTIGIERM